MITYSECLLKLKDKLEELGLPGESTILKKFGNTVFTTSESALLPFVLGWEIQIRELEKETVEIDRKLAIVKEEQEKKELLAMRLTREVERLFPIDKVSNAAYKTVYSSFVDLTVQDIIKAGSLSMDEDFNLVAGDQPERHPENMNELDRLLFNARVSRFGLAENNIEDLINQTATNRGSSNFFRL